MSDELPKGWASAPLREVAEINPRHPKGLDDQVCVRGRQPLEPLFFPNDVPHLRINEVRCEQAERAGLVLVEHSSRVVGIWLNHKPLDGDTTVNNGLVHRLSFSVFADERHAVRQLSIGHKESLPQGINPADHTLAAEQPIFLGLPCFKQLFNAGQAVHLC